MLTLKNQLPIGLIIIFKLFYSIVLTYLQVIKSIQNHITIFSIFFFFFLNSKLGFSTSNILKSSNFCLISGIFRILTYCVKSDQIRSFLWSVFPRIQSEYEKIRSTKNFVFAHFSNSGYGGLDGGKHSNNGLPGVIKFPNFINKVGVCIRSIWSIA